MVRKCGCCPRRPSRSQVRPASARRCCSTSTSTGTRWTPSPRRSWCPAGHIGDSGGVPNAGIDPGDLLVLVRDNDFFGGSGGSDGGAYDSKEPALVYDYPATGIKQVLTGAASSVSPTILLWELSFPYPSGAVPNGIDIWPIDGSLLISTNLGTILQYRRRRAATNPSRPAGRQALHEIRVVSCAFASPARSIRSGPARSPIRLTRSPPNPPGRSGNILYFSVPTGTSTPAGGFGFTTGTACDQRSDGVVPTALRSHRRPSWWPPPRRVRRPRVAIRRALWRT